VAAEIPAYGPLPKVKIFLPFMKNHLVQIRKEDLKPGDVLMVCVKSWPMHVGIVGDGRDGLTMIHADALFKRVIEQKLDDKVVVHSYYRFPSLAREEA
jgi:hypothetical protein